MSRSLPIADSNSKHRLVERHREPDPVALVRLGVLNVTAAASSSTIVPVALSVAITVSDVPETGKLTVNVSSSSASPSLVVATVNVCVAPVVPLKLNRAPFSGSARHERQLAVGRDDGVVRPPCPVTVVPRLDARVRADASTRSRRG